MLIINTPIQQNHRNQLLQINALSSRPGLLGEGKYRPFYFDSVNEYLFPG
jgi:hypothetical protein